MKKIISVFLSFALLIGLAFPVFSAVDANECHSQIPVIRISGDGEALYDSDGNKIFHYKDIAKLFKSEGDSGSDNSELYKSMAETLLPAVVKGLTLNDWDDLYSGLETEISKIFSNSLLDENGNVTNGSGLSQRRKDQMYKKRNYYQMGSKG